MASVDPSDFKSDATGVKIKTRCKLRRVKTLRGKVVPLKSHCWKDTRYTQYRITKKG